MTVELRPLGVRCNIQCQYCYQESQRDAGNLRNDYSLEKMKAAILAEGGPFSLFGGEPLLVPEEDLENLWKWGFEQFGRNSIQTNGTLINQEHLRMFKQYKVQVGISIDGPDDFNDVRWIGNLAKTREATAKTLTSIERLCHEGMPPSLIVTLHQNNATSDRLPKLMEWIRYLDSLGVKWLRLHLLEVENQEIRKKYALSVAENIAALFAFRAIQPSLRCLQIDLFEDVRKLLIGRDGGTTCVWNACDPYTTRAVRGIEGQGQRSNCGRTNKDGIDFLKADDPGFERYLALYSTPQEAGGCKDCRFFLMCKGQCPGTAIDGDWRNRTEHCEVWKAVFSAVEAELMALGKTPLSQNPKLRRVESEMLRLLSSGKQPSLSKLTSGGASAPAVSGWRLQLKELRQTMHEVS